MSTTTGQRLTTRNKVGLVMAGLLGVVDLSGPSPAGFGTLLFVPEFSIEPVLPLVLGGFITAGLLGLATVAGVVVTWTKRNRVAARVVAGARVISALMTALLFLVPSELAAWALVLAAMVVILDIVAVVLVLSRPAGPLPAAPVPVA